VCCGRQDLLVRALHLHYCNLCDGDWDHEGVCVDSLALCCPWCFPKSDSEPAPGARSGPHFHYCSECGQNWQHETGCSAPLRAALPECTGCRRTSAGSDEERPELAPTIPVRPRRTLAERVRPLALPIGIAAGVLLSLPILFKGYSALQSPAVKDSTTVMDPRPEVNRPAPTPIAPAPTEPTLDVARPPAEPPPAKSKTARAVSNPLPAPRIPAPSAEARRVPAIDQPAQQRAQDVRPWIRRSPEPAVPSQTASRPPDSASGKTDDLGAIPAAPPAPSPVRSELIADSAPPARETPPAANESGVRATPMIVIWPSIPVAPPFGGLTGGSGRDTSLDGHPRRVRR